MQFSLVRFLIGKQPKMNSLVFVVVLGLFSASLEAARLTRTRALPICHTVGELLPNPDDCNTFYECSDEGPELMQCPDNSEFSPISHECDDPDVAGCAAESCNKIGELTPNPADCGSFFECTLDGPELIYCPAGLAFNPKTNKCDAPYVSGCTNVSPGVPSSPTAVPTAAPTPSPTAAPPAPTTTTPLPPTAGPVSTSSPAPVTSGPGPRPPQAGCRQIGDLIPNPIDCQSFFECTLQGPILVPCASGSEFNPIELACDRPENANCRGITCPRVGDLLPNPYDCVNYVECTTSGPVIMPCPPDLQYNKLTQKCDITDNGRCP